MIKKTIVLGLILGLVTGLGAAIDDYVEHSPDQDDEEIFEYRTQPQDVVTTVDWSALHDTHDQDEYMLENTAVMSTDFDFERGSISALEEEPVYTREEIENEEYEGTYEGTYAVDALLDTLDPALDPAEEDVGLRTAIQGEVEGEFVGFYETTFMLDYEPESYSAANLKERKSLEQYENYTITSEDTNEYSHLEIKYLDDELQAVSTFEGGIPLQFFEITEDSENFEDVNGAFQMISGELEGLIQSPVTFPVSYDNENYVKYFAGGESSHFVDFGEDVTADITYYYYEDDLDLEEIEVGTGEYLRENYDTSDTQSFSTEDVVDNEIVFDHDDSNIHRTQTFEIEFERQDDAEVVEWSQVEERFDRWGYETIESDVYELEDGAEKVELREDVDGAEYVAPTVLMANYLDDEPRVTEYSYEYVDEQGDGMIAFLLPLAFGLLMILVVVSGWMAAQKN